MNDYKSIKASPSPLKEGNCGDAKEALVIFC